MSSNFYPDDPNIDLREEFDALLFGRVDIIPIGRPVLIRRITDIHCVCWDGVSGGPDRFCSYCHGEGWQYYENLETFYIARGVAPIYKPGVLASGLYPMAQYGYTDPNRATGWCNYKVFPDYERYTLQQHHSYDKLYELKVAEDGSLITPYVHTAKWKMLNVIPLFGDFGRVEFIEVSLERENV